MNIFERLFDLLAGLWRYLLPFVVLGDDQVGLIRRLGVYHRDLRHGLNWKWPVVEQELIETSALDSAVLREQSLTCKDGVQVTLRGVITYRVVNPRAYILDVDNPLTVINDAGCAVIGELIPELDSTEVLSGTEFMSKLTRRVRARAKRWGIDVDAVGFVDRTKARTIRLLGIGGAEARGWVS